MLGHFATVQLATHAAMGRLSTPPSTATPLAYSSRRAAAVVAATVSQPPSPPPSGRSPPPPIGHKRNFTGMPKTASPVASPTSSGLSSAKVGGVTPPPPAALPMGSAKVGSTGGTVSDKAAVASTRLPGGGGSSATAGTSKLGLSPAAAEKALLRRGLQRAWAAVDGDRHAHHLVAFKSLLERWRDFPWKSCVAFMIAWSWLGVYAVPYFKAKQESHSKEANDKARHMQRVIELRREIAFARRAKAQGEN